MTAWVAEPPHLHVADQARHLMQPRTPLCALRYRRELGQVMQEMAVKGEHPVALAAHLGCCRAGGDARRCHPMAIDPPSHEHPRRRSHASMCCQQEDGQCGTQA